MSRNWTKFRLLMWKNFTLQKRHRKQTAVEILVPVFFSLVLVLIRSLVVPENMDQPTLFHPFDPGSMNGTVPSLVPMALFWAPNCSILQPVMADVAKKLNISRTVGLDTDDLKQVTEEQSSNMDTILAAVYFEDALKNLNQLPNKFNITVRFPGESRTAKLDPLSALSANWQTNHLFPVFQVPGPRDSQDEGGNKPGYYAEGFLALQNAISVSIIEHMTHIKEIPEIKLQRFPYPPYIDDPLLAALEGFVSLIIMVSFVYTCKGLVAVVTTEKELQLKEAMKIMGLPNWLHWTAWYLKSIGYLLVSVVLMVVLMKVPWLPETDSSVFTYTDASVLLVFLILYILTIISFCFMISVFFSKANTATTVAGLMWFISYAPYLFLKQSYGDISLSTKLAACLLSNSAMSFGFQLILMHEGTGEGAQWSNLFTPVTPDDNFVFGHIMGMLILDSTIYFLITLYVEAVLPGTYGVPKPWYFLVTRSYWCGDPAYQIEENHEDNTGFSSDVYEQDPKNLHAGVKVKHLHKAYGKKVAVKDLSLSMYEGQITVLLGHNGAGKTTTMSMLTGMITPTRGTAIVGDYDIRTDIENVRDSLGLCPQHNVLFDELTVREHLYFFGKLKGLDGNELENEIIKYVEMLELMPKINAQAHTLSGGMKRKLSAGVALCGDSKIVLLDEPTSGMDPAARRALWDIFQAEKRGRTILLSTHFMDEADILGDRIAIMAGGELQCCGSSFFLKKRYGAGYHLIIVKGTSCKVNSVTTLLRRHIPSVEVSQNIGSELSYLLDENQSSLFEPMLRELEEKKIQLDIDSYGVSLTTLEEVFMKVGKDEDTETAMPEFELSSYKNEKDFEDSAVPIDIPYMNSSRDTIVNIDSSYKLYGFRLAMAQFFAMFMKRALYTWRTLVLFFIQILIPVTLLTITILVVNVWQMPEELPPLFLSLNSYSRSYTPVECLANGTNVDFCEEYKHQITTGLQEIDSKVDHDMTSYMLQKAKADISRFREKYIVGATFDLLNSSSAKIIGWFNNQPYHAIPVALNLIHNSILKAFNQSYSLDYVNSPLPFTSETKITMDMTGNNLGFQVAFNIAFSMSIVSAFYLLFYVKERVNKAKHLQYVSGVNIFTFWLAAFLWDFIQLLAPTIGIIITMAAFQEDNFKTADELGRIFAVLVAFGFAALPLMYVASFLFTNPSTGLSRVAMFSILGGVAGFMTVTILKLPTLDLTDVANILDWILSFIPHYTLAICLENMYLNSAIQKACQPMLPFCNLTRHRCCRDNCLDDCLSYSDNYFDWEEPGIGRHLTFFFIDGIIFIVVLFLIEYRAFEMLKYWFQKSKNNVPSTDDDDEPGDSDVVAEKFRIQENNLLGLVQSHALVLRNVSKCYGSFVAVNDMCVGVKKGECFGLLGQNGAGKTSTFKMMTGDETISFGDAYVNGFNLKTNMKEVHQTIGYCPQFDALIEDLTGRETIWMYCMLRGVPPSMCSPTAVKLATQFCFIKHIDKKIKQYSGGNKRKLSTALALVGDPSVIYLDEPTTGMDPSARRKLWNIICNVRDSGKCIILTSHSMEECEALCTRIAIMVNGKFKCLGSTQHLKSKFAEGYTVSIKVRKLDPFAQHNQSLNVDLFDMDPIKKFIIKSFSGAVLREEYQGLLTYYIPSPEMTWSRMFGMMEKAKKQLNIEDYSLGQTSLEQIFLTFTKSQYESSL